jgi:hypothetical protein
MPDETNLFKTDDDPFFHHGRAVNFGRILVSLTFLLFLAPAIFLALSAVIATSSGPGILRWIGVPTLVGGALSFGMSKLCGGLLHWGAGAFPYSWSYHSSFSHVEEVFIEKTGDICMLVAGRLFSAVDTVAGVVCIIGIVLIALSYTIAHEKKSSTGTSVPNAPQPQPQPQPETKPEAQDQSNL